jgi:hypothetical protein
MKEENRVTEDQRLETISMAAVIYDKVEDTSDNFMICKIGNEKAIVNYYGVELLRVGLDSRIIDTGSKRFIAFEYSKDRKNKVSLLDTVLEKSVELQTDWSYWSSYTPEVKVLDDKVIVLLDSDKNLTFYNMSLEKIGELKEHFGLSVSGLKIYRGGINGYYSISIPKRSSFTAMQRTGELEKYNIIIDATHSRIVSYEIKNITNSVFDAVAVRQDSNYECLLYKLGISSNTISEKSYHLIEKPLNLKGTDLFQVYNKISNTEYQTGLICEEGTEVLEPIYSELQFLSTELYVVSYKRDNETYKGIYKRGQGMLVNLSDASSIVMHPTLPIAMIWLRDGSFELMNNQGIRFSIDKFSKYFNCSHVGDIIKVDLGYKTEFISTQLTPITNYTILSKLENATWAEM